MALKKVIDLGFSHRHVNFNDVKFFKTIGNKGRSKTYGSISLYYSVAQSVGVGGPSIDENFQIFEDDDWPYDVIFKMGEGPQTEVQVVCSAIESKHKATKGTCVATMLHCVFQGTLREVSRTPLAIL